MASPAEQSQGVRFAAKDEEIAPDEVSEHQSLHVVETMTGKANRRDDLNPEAEQELQQLKTTLRNNIQSARMQCHAFEPVSLPGSQPASRVRPFSCMCRCAQRLTEDTRSRQAQQHQAEDTCQLVLASHRLRHRLRLQLYIHLPSHPLLQSPEMGKPRLETYLNTYGLLML